MQRAKPARLWIAAQSCALCRREVVTAIIDLCLARAENKINARRL